MRFSVSLKALPKRLLLSEDSRRSCLLWILRSVVDNHHVLAKSDLVEDRNVWAFSQCGKQPRVLQIDL